MHEHARPVVGGIFIKMLAEPELWKKWASRDKAHAANWADAPTPAKVTEVVPTSRQRGIESFPGGKIAVRRFNT